MPRTVAVLIPGIMGSTLHTPEGKQIWPASITELLLPYSHMMDLMRDDLLFPDIIRSIAIADVYGRLVDHLGRCGFRESDRPQSLYVLPYDWRKTNVIAAEGLDTLLSRAISDHGPETRIYLVAHSMGGLIARYFLESGKFEGRSSWSAVHRLITLGTPHRGAPLALTAAMGKEKRVFLSAEQVRSLANDERFPSLYELLPPRGEPFAWNMDSGYEHVDVYEPKVAASLTLKQRQLAAATAFHSGLSLERRPAHVRYFFFLGTRQRTTTAVTLREAPGNPGAFLPSGTAALEADDAGDGTVPSWSGTVTSMQSQPVSGEHSTIFRSAELRLTLGALLDKPGTLAPESSPQVEVAVRDRVVYPRSRLHIGLVFRAARSSVKGELVLSPHGGWGQVERYPIAYSGLEAENVSVAAWAPAVVGIYNVSFHEGTSELGSDELFVQSND